MYREKKGTDDPLLATAYTNIGSAYKAIGKYDDAMLNYNRSLEIKKKDVEADDPSLAPLYGNLGFVYG